MVIIPGTTIFGPNDKIYEVLDYIGNGNFGMVHKVKQCDGEQVLAMKTIPTPFADEIALKAFVNEGNLAVAIRHPNVIEYVFFHDGSKHDSLPPYILMEYADGGTLDSQIAKAADNKKPFSNSDLSAMFKQLAAGMKAINDKLIHRDIKPDNILICKNTLKISDFGLSKVVTEATRKSSFKGFGCIQYMAPEAWRFERNTPQLDIYSMGMVFYQLATLQHPFNIPTPDPHKWMEAHFYQPVPRPDSLNRLLEPKLAQIIIRMVEKDPAKRFKDWTEIQTLLENSGNYSHGNVNALVEGMLQRRLQQDNATQMAEAKKREEQNRIEQFCKLAISQVEQAVVLPVKEIVAEFNRQYPGKKITEDLMNWVQGFRQGESLRYGVSFPSGSWVAIEFQVLLERDFIREIPPDWRHMHPHKAVCIPTFRSRRVQGWGKVQGSDGRGFNILLLEKPNEIYGELIILKNGMGFPSGAESRPEPFAFEFPEFERELTLIDAIHIYSTTVSAFDVDYLRNFVVGYV